MSFETSVRAAHTAGLGTGIRNSTILWLGDVISALLAFVLAGLVAYALSDAVARGLDSPEQNEHLARRLIHYGVFVAGVMSWLAVQGHYSRRIPWATEVKQILLACTFAGVLDGFAQYAFRAEFSRLWLGINWAVLACVLVAARHTIKSALLAAGLWQLPTLMVGTGSVAAAARTALGQERHLGYEVVEAAPLRTPRESAAAAAERILATLHSSGARFVVVAPEADEIARSNPLLTALTRKRISFALIPSIGGMSVLGLRSDYFFSHDVVLLTGQHNLAEPLARAIKRGIDITAAGLLLLLLGPFFLGTALILRAEGGPVFVRHRRVGLRGRSFGCLKFRTFRMDSETVRMGAPVGGHGAEEDRAVSAFGLFLRRSSLDELPQLLNVLCGEMSLVGPRPIVAAEQGLYGDHLDYYCEVRPGITGIWQVSGRQNSSYERRIQLDAWYVRNWSLWHDVTIIAKTLRLLLSNGTGN